MFCAECGQKFSDGNKFCSSCGTPIAKPEKTDISITAIKDDAYVPKLLEYLRTIIYCETNLIGYDSIIEENNKAMGLLCIPNLLPNEPIKPSPPKRFYSIVGIVITWAIGVSILLTSAMPLGVIILVALGIYILTVVKRRSDEMKSFRFYENKYYMELEEYRKLNQKELVRMHSESAQKKLYEEQSERITELISHAKGTLKTLYEANVLHLKYQNFVASASIYDYLSTDRTYTLGLATGDPGAYNMYEEDVRIGRIVNAFGMFGTQIINAVQGLGSDIRNMNTSICDAIETASKMQLSATSEISTGIQNMSIIGEANRYNTEMSNRHLEKIAEYNRIRTEALRKVTPWGSVIEDKSGFRVT